MTIRIKVNKENFGDPFRFSLGQANAVEVSNCVYNGLGKVILEGSEKECCDFISQLREEEIKKIELTYLFRYAIGYSLFKKNAGPKIYPAIDGGVCYGYGELDEEGFPMFPVLKLRVIEEQIGKKYL